MFGWKGDSLQRAMDSPCYVNCPTLKTQSISEMNKCAVPNTVDENFDGCEQTPVSPRGVDLRTDKHGDTGLNVLPGATKGHEMKA